jgi:ornithine cyclodeaminase/alanine dehydrogenase-like protein (mu-crystallin family)
MTGHAGTLVLTRRDVAALVDPDDCARVVEDAFRLRAGGRAPAPAVASVPAATGGFHVKAAALKTERAWFAAKVNGNFPDNQQREGLPTIQGVIVLCDASNGRVLAVMDSIEITLLRTAAATAVAAKYLARPDSHVAAVCGCGVQGRAQLRALVRVLPLRRVYAYDSDHARAEGYASELARELGIAIVPTPTAGEATRVSDVCLTCTTARRAFLGRGDIRPGTFLAAVGADNEDKQELEPDLLAASTVVADILEQSATIGDLHHAIANGLMTKANVHAELGDIVAGRKPGRRSADEIIVFDSTGTALQDVAVGALVYERALAAGAGIQVLFGA